MFYELFYEEGWKNIDEDICVVNRREWSRYFFPREKILLERNTGLSLYLKISRISGIARVLGFQKRT